MKKNIFLSGIIFIVTFCFTGCSKHVDKNKEITLSTDYYWYKGEKIELSKSRSKKYILFKTGNEQAVRTSLKNTASYISGKVVLALNFLNPESEKEQAECRWMIVEKRDMQKSIPEIIYDGPCFISKEGKELTLSHLFYVKLKNTGDLSQLQKTASVNKVEILGNNRNMPLWYTLSCTKESAGNALEMANKFYETRLFSAAEPDLMSDDIPTQTNKQLTYS